MGVNALIKKVLAEVGIKPERFNLQWASAAEAPRFVKLITEFTDNIKELGPIGDSEGLSDEEVKERLTKALDIVSGKKLRVVYGNMTKTMRKEGTNLTDDSIADLVEQKLTKSLSGLSG